MGATSSKQAGHAHAKRCGVARATARCDAKTMDETVLANLANRGDGKRSHPAQVLNAHEADATRRRVQQERLLTAEHRSAQHLVHRVPCRGQRACLCCRDGRRPPHHQLRMRSGTDKVLEAASGDAKQLAVTCVRCQLASGGDNSCAVASCWLGRARIFAQHEQHVTEVEAHRLHLHLHLVGRERLIKRGLLGQHHA